MPRRRVMIASIVTALLLGSAGLAVAGGRHGDLGESWAGRPAPTHTGKHRKPHPGPTSTASPSTPVPTPTTSVRPTPKPPTEPTGTQAPNPTQPSGPSGGSWWRPAVGTTWQWQLTGKLDLSAKVQVYDVDLFDTSAADVAAIHAKGAKAICYLETGAWESYRPDASRYPSGVLGKAIDGYPEERYVDVRNLDVLRPIIDARLDLCAQKGFDGVEPDIDDSFVDVGASGIGFPVTYADQLAFNRMVAADAHARGLAIGLKNGTYGDRAAQFVKDIQPSVDYAVNEECAAEDACGMLAVFTDNGKPVFHTEYLGDYRQASTSNYSPVLNTFCPVTRPLRFSSILKDASESLSAWRQACP